MKLFYLAILYRDESKPRVLSSASELGSFGYFQRSSVSEFMSFTSGVVVQRAAVGSRSVVKQDEYNCFVFVRFDSLSAVLIGDLEYPQRVAFTLLSKCVDEFSELVPRQRWPTTQAKQVPAMDKKLAEYLAKFQNPQQADAMSRLESDLDDTKVVLYDTIEKLLERGEKLDDLVAKSDALSMQSKAFYTTARKTNSCCKMW